MLSTKFLNCFSSEIQLSNFLFLASSNKGKYWSCSSITVSIAPLNQMQNTRFFNSGGKSSSFPKIKQIEKILLFLKVSKKSIT